MLKLTTSKRGSCLLRLWNYLSLPVHTVDVCKYRILVDAQSFLVFFFCRLPAPLMSKQLITAYNRCFVWHRRPNAMHYRYQTTTLRITPRFCPRLVCLLFSLAASIQVSNTALFFTNVPHFGWKISLQAGDYDVKTANIWQILLLKLTKKKRAKLFSCIVWSKRKAIRKKYGEKKNRKLRRILRHRWCENSLICEYGRTYWR